MIHEVEVLEPRKMFDIKEPMAKLPPDVYRELVNELRHTAHLHANCGSLREALSSTLSRYVMPDHGSKR